MSNPLVIFDCDGVVVDSMHLHTEVEAVAYQSIGIDITAEELVRRFSGVSDAEVNRILEEETGRVIPLDIAAQIEKRKKEVFAQRLKPIANIRETLAAIKSIPRCIASGTGIEGLRHMLDVVKLYDIFAPHIYSSEMVTCGKPFPDLFLYAAQQMGHEPATCLVIEDGVAGVEAGRAAGMLVFGFDGGSHCDDGHCNRLKAVGAELIFSDMRELPSLIERYCKN